MRYTAINKNLFIRNREKLIKMIKSNALVVMHSNDELLRNGDQYFPFRQHSDIFYLTGLDQEKCILTICPNHPNVKFREIIFTIKADEQLTTWQGHKYTEREIQEISGIKTVMWLDDFEITFRDLMYYANTVYLNQNEYIKLSTEVPSKDLRFARYLKDNFPVYTYERLAPMLTSLRLVKEPEEVALIQIACDLTEKAFRRLLRFVRPGIMEYEVEAEITHEFIRNGSNGHAYQPIIASGKNALALHYHQNDNICQNGDLLLMDFGAEYANYAADCTRTIPVNGKFSMRQHQVYDAVLRVQQNATGLYVPGNSIDEINHEVNRLTEKELIGLGLFSDEDVQNQNPDKPLFSKYLMHGVCHPVGLDVHDPGGKYVPFCKGMILTLEPAIYIPEENIGVRLENNIMVGDIPVNLMKNIPIEANEIESLMTNHKNQ
ncbi:MAG: aminopeptidase P N-terminal domain-containing protein [Bacteroidetes bacterium]|nr:aminopeptidase P N-terminal domain-containing protein [Bacteroidota bacterium]